MDWHGSTVYSLDDGDNSIQYMVELLGSHNYYVLQDTDVEPLHRQHYCGCGL